MTLLILIGVTLSSLAALAILVGLALGRAAASEDVRRRECRLIDALLAQSERSAELDALATEVDAIASEVGEIACEIARFASGTHHEADMVRLRVVESKMSSHLAGEGSPPSRLPAEAA
jgi:hypothetical protein